MHDQSAVRKPYIGLIDFGFAPYKASKCLEWVGGRFPGLSFADLCLVMLVAERSHLNLFGRVIVGASYRVLEDGTLSSPELASVLENPPEDARWSYSAEGGLFASAGDGVPAESSLSDAEHLDMAAKLVAGERAAADALVVRSSHDGRIDHALMVDDEDDAALVSKLSEIHDLCGYHYLGD